MNEAKYILHSLSKAGRKYLKSNYTSITNNLISERTTEIDFIRNGTKSNKIFLKYSKNYMNFS